MIKFNTYKTIDYHIFNYKGIKLCMNTKKKYELLHCITEALEILKSEKQISRVDTVELPVININLHNFIFSIATIYGNSTITITDNNKILDSTTYSYNGLYEIKNKLNKI